MYQKLLITIFAIAVALPVGPPMLVVYGQAEAERPAVDLSRYLDPASGLNADDVVTLVLENNGELLAFRKDVDASRAMIRQALLRPNPKLTLSGAKQIGAKDSSQTSEFLLPLELGGRRAARVAVAKRELEAREFELANQERSLAADARLKFGESLAAIKKLEVIESTLAAARQGFELVAARVREGKIPPLEQNIFLVEVNRLQSIRESAEGKVETAMFELRNMAGKKPEELFRLRGSFSSLIGPLPQLTVSTENALLQRPDLQGARSVELLASAKIEQARSEGRIDAGIKAGYQRADSSFPLSGYDDHGVLRPIQDVFHFFTFGLEIDLPVRNRNQGAVEAATFEREAARRRIEFGELTIRREVAAAFAKYNRAARSLSIFQNGVRDQAKANLQVIWQTYELGGRSLLDYIADERRFLDVENELIDVEFETYSANIEIMRAVNMPELKKK